MPNVSLSESDNRQQRTDGTSTLGAEGLRQLISTNIATGRSSLTASPSVSGEGGWLTYILVGGLILGLLVMARKVK